MIGYGAPRPAGLPAGCLFLQAPLCPLDGGAAFEVWSAASALRRVATGAVRGACNDDIAFGAVRLGAGGLAAATERAYLEIFDFLRDCGDKTPIRFWNYLTAITADEDGMERYRGFNIGRQRAFAARLEQKLPPAATAVGGHGGDSVIYFLGGPQPAQPVENPRQVSAYDYPPLYGPRSPSFSRAAIFRRSGRSCLFVSGTASIVGHRSRHPGELGAQIGETVENLRAVIAEADRSGCPPPGEWAVKIYLSDTGGQQEAAAAVAAIFGSGCQTLYLRGDICRRELRVEIEAFRQFGQSDIRSNEII